MLLCSGGLDSCVAGAVLSRRGSRLTLLHVDYGQVGLNGERRAIKACLPFLAADRVISLDVSALRAFGAGTLVDETAEAEFFPHRNLVLVAAASVVASKLGIARLAMGVIDMANAEFEDCRPPFMAALTKLLLVSKPKLKLEQPLGSKTKVEVVRTARRIAFPYELTFSCNRLADRHCWRCGSCRERAEAHNAMRCATGSNTDAEFEAW